MLILRNLDEGQIHRLHEEHMSRDFPPSELKGVNAILNLWSRGEYDVLAADLNGVFAAYALVYRPSGSRMMLLDYLAVLPQARGQGLGKTLLAALQNHYAREADCLMVECERPKAAPDEQEARRRIRFYQQAGAQLTPVRIWLFDVEYSILALPCAGAQISDEMNWAELMLGLYRRMLPAPLFEQNVRLIRG